MIRCLIRSKPGTAGLYTSLTMAMRRMLTANQPELGLRPSFFSGKHDLQSARKRSALGTCVPIEPRRTCKRLMDVLGGSSSG